MLKPRKVFSHPPSAICRYKFAKTQHGFITRTKMVDTVNCHSGIYSISWPDTRIFHVALGRGKYLHFLKLFWIQYCVAGIVHEDWFKQKLGSNSWQIFLFLGYVYGILCSRYCRILSFVYEPASCISSVHFQASFFPVGTRISWAQNICSFLPCTSSASPWSSYWQYGDWRGRRKPVWRSILAGGAGSSLTLPASQNIYLHMYVQLLQFGTRHARHTGSDVRDKYESYRRRKSPEISISALVVQKLEGGGGDVEA